jgi:acyl-ACP thioesterase
MSAGPATPQVDYRDEYLVRSYEVEPDGRLRPVVLLRMLQETAWNHASRLGKGFSKRASGELFWVLSRLRVQIDAYPRWGERFTIQTYPVGTERLLAIREFALLDEAGDRVLGRAWSGWLILDGDAGRPLRPEPAVADIETLPAQYRGATDRITTLGNTPVETMFEGTVYHHDIDQYRHVNNASYLEWVLDGQPEERHRGEQPSLIALDFVRETVRGDAFEVVAAREDSLDRFEVRHADGETAVRGVLEWAPAVDRSGSRR